MSTTSAAIANEIFVRNMRFLWRHDPQLGLRIDAVSDDQRYVVESSRGGEPTVRVELPNGQSTYLHSRIDPVAEAQRWADAATLEDQYCFVVSGFGLGHHLLALHRRIKGDALIICIEPSMRLIATALAAVDLSELLEAERLIILADADKGRLHARLQPLSPLMMLGAQFLRHAPSVRLAEAEHAQINEAIGEFVTFSRMSIMTLMSNARVTCTNLAMNFVHYVSTPPIDVLRNRFAGNPAIVVSAGPSLSRNIDQLADLKGRAVLCAVQTSLRPLMERGIVPDFVTSLDFHEISRRFFENVGDLRRTHLVAEPKAAWAVLDHYPGPISLLDNHWVRLVLDEQLGARAGLQAGATVAHLAFYLAVFMGCDPIIFVGQDLAFTGHVFYTPGVEVHRSWRSEINRFNSMEQKEWDRIARNRPILRKVMGHDGRLLFTDELLCTYLEQFEKDVAAVPRRVINATQGGAHIRGTAALTLREAAATYCTVKIGAERFAYLDSVQWRDASPLPAAMEQVEARLRELNRAFEVCDELLGLFDRLEKITHDPREFNRLIVRVDELRSEVQADSRSYRIISSATQLVEYRRFSADRSMSRGEEQGPARAKRQIARDREFIAGVRDGACEAKRMLEQSLDRLQNPPWLEPLNDQAARSVPPGQVERGEIRRRGAGLGGRRTPQMRSGSSTGGPA